MQKNYENELAEIAVEDEAPTKKVREKRKRAKSYAQYNEDGTRSIDPVSGAGIWGPEPCPNKPTKAPKAPKVVEYQKDEAGNDVLDEEGNPIPVKRTRQVRNLNLVCNGKPYDLKASVNDTLLVVLKPAHSKEGSKRMERAKALEGASTVQDFFANGGLVRDLVRYISSGVVELEYNGHSVTIEKAE